MKHLQNLWKHHRKREPKHVLRPSEMNPNKKIPAKYLAHLRDAIRATRTNSGLQSAQAIAVAIAARNPINRRTD